GLCEAVEQPAGRGEEQRLHSGRADVDADDRVFRHAPPTLRVPERFTADAGAAPHPYPLPVKDGEREASASRESDAIRTMAAGCGQGQWRAVSEGYSR